MNSGWGGVRLRRAQKNIMKPMATRRRVPPIEAPAIIAIVEDLVLLLEVAESGVLMLVLSGEGVKMRVLDRTMSVVEKTPEEISMEEVIVEYSITVEGCTIKVDVSGSLVVSVPGTTATVAGCGGGVEVAGCGFGIVGVVVIMTAEGVVVTTTVNIS